MRLQVGYVANRQFLYKVGQKTAHGFLCYNFAYSQSSFHNFWRMYTIGNLQLDDA